MAAMDASLLARVEQLTTTRRSLLTEMGGPNGWLVREDHTAAIAAIDREVERLYGQVRQARAGQAEPPPCMYPATPPRPAPVTRAPEPAGVEPEPERPRQVIVIENIIRRRRELRAPKRDWLRLL